MNATLKTLVGAIAAIWIVLLAGMVILAQGNPSETRFADGGLEGTVAEVEDLNLTATAVAPADVYGEEFAFAAFICPGMTEQDISEFYGVDASALELDGAVPQDLNYLMLVRQDGTTEYDAIARDAIDLCTAQTYPVPANALVPLAQTEQGGWQLLV
ncbi:MAG: hypothetical protein Q4F37_08090 [Corynebacterium sp.]|uniref:hypothetical protein n=1 Tax=Corynebacterium sp. TaxID=1720 RepID=UPI0026FC14A8|nr:hypothetical protein [Corynebacterium sp.]